jgi:ABC-type transport system substrate-binding protein
MFLREAFDYPFSRIDPRDGAHIDPPSVAIYETLVTKAPDWWAAPTLVEGWDISPDGLEWRFRVRPAVTFHSGHPCDAPALAAAFEHLRFGGGTDQLWYWDPVDTIAAPDPGTLVFRLHYPYARLPSLLWGTHTAIHCEATRRADPARHGYAVADGTGPFRLTSWSPERVVAERFDGYHGSRPPLDRIEWVAIAGEADRLAALEAGEVDCMHGPPLAEVERLRADPRFRVISYPQQSSVYLALDFHRTDLRFDDLRVRHALSLALDRATIADGPLCGLGTPTYGPVPPGDEYYDPAVDATPRHDPSEAGRLLDAAGVLPGADGIRIEVECVSQDDAILRRVAEEVAAQLLRIGVRLRLRHVVPFADFYAALDEGPPAFIGKWLWQDPMDAFIGFAATWAMPMPNWQHASLPALDAAFSAWLRAGSRSELAEAAAHAQRVAAAELPYIPLVTPTDVFVHHRGVHGWTPYPANLYPFYGTTHVERGP